MKAKIRYRLYVTHPLTKKETVSITIAKLDTLAQRIALNVFASPDWYTLEKAGKKYRAALRIVCERVVGKKIEVLETYKISRDYKRITGFCKNWEDLGKNSKKV